MFSQIAKDMNELMESEMDKTSAVILFMVLVWIGFMIFGHIGAIAIVATELFRYWRECNS